MKTDLLRTAIQLRENRIALGRGCISAHEYTRRTTAILHGVPANEQANCLRLAALGLERDGIEHRGRVAARDLSDSLRALKTLDERAELEPLGGNLLAEARG